MSAPTINHQNLRQSIMDEMKKAMLEKNPMRLKILRLMQASLKDKDINNRTSNNKDGIDNNSIITMLQSMVKQRRDAIALYQTGGRPELAASEQQEIDVLKEFLPVSLDGAELEQAIKTIATELNANSMKDMGKVITALKEKYQGKIDASLAAGKVKDFFKTLT